MKMGRVWLSGAEAMDWAQVESQELLCKIRFFKTNSEGYGEEFTGCCPRGISGVGQMDNVPREPSTAPGTQ